MNLKNKNPPYNTSEDLIKDHFSIHDNLKNLFFLKSERIPSGAL